MNADRPLSMARRPAGIPRLEGSHDLAREPLELLEVVVARRQHHILNAGALEVADPLDDLAGGPEEVRLLEVL